MGEKTHRVQLLWPSRISACCHNPCGPGFLSKRIRWKTSGCLSWVAFPFNHNILLPNGAIGKLVVEAPMIFDRYIGNNRPQSSLISPRLATSSNFQRVWSEKSALLNGWPGPVRSRWQFSDPRWFKFNFMESTWSYPRLNIMFGSFWKVTWLWLLNLLFWSLMVA